jgi:DNA-binding XRE family transcriptional regulator
MMNEKLRAARLERKMTQWDMALTLDIGFSTYYQWEQEIHHPNRESRRRLCEFFGMTEEELGLPQMKVPESKEGKRAYHQKHGKQYYSRLKADVRTIREKRIGEMNDPRNECSI